MRSSVNMCHMLESSRYMSITDTTDLCVRRAVSQGGLLHEFELIILVPLCTCMIPTVMARLGPQDGGIPHKDVRHALCNSGRSDAGSTAVPFAR